MFDRALPSLKETEPFTYFILEDVLGEEACDRIISSLDNLEWTPSKGAFFEFENPVRKSKLKNIVPEELIAHLKTEAERTLDCQLDSEARAGCQKYIQHSGIGPHTDAGLHVFRFILNLNRGWRLSHGGLWILSRTSQLSSPTLVPPKNNCGFGFVPGTATYHALSERRESTSYGLILEYPLKDSLERAPQIPTSATR